MRAAQMKDRPNFTLMTQNDVQNSCYMQMPRWLFSDPHYAVMSLNAKVAYTFLLILNTNQSKTKSNASR